MKGHPIDEKLLRLLYWKEKSALAGPSTSDSRSRQIESIFDRLSKDGPRWRPWDQTDRLTFFVTRACQLECKYCYVSKSSRHMSWEVARKGIELLMSGNQRDIEIHFIGGEPLLRYDLLQKVILEAERLKSRFHKRPHYVLSTNALTLDREKIAFFKRFDCFIATSLDGGEEVYGLHRSSAKGHNLFQRIKANLDRLKDSGLRYQVTLVVTPESAPHLEEDSATVASMGHPVIMINYHTGCYWPEQAQALLLRGMLRLSDLGSKPGGFKFINALGESEWVEPHILDPDLTLDFDGGLYPITAVILEKNLGIQLEEFRLAKADSIGRLDDFRISPVDLFLSYSKSSRWREDPEFRRLILNNIEIGMRVRDSFRAKGEALPPENPSRLKAEIGWSQ